MWFPNGVLLQAYLTTFLALDQAFAISVRRSRFDGPERPPVGPPNGAPQCDLKYGTPTRNDCDFAIDWISGVPAYNEDGMELDQAAWDAYHHVYYTIVEFLNPQAERQNRQRPAVRTPKFWRSGNCVISVTVMQGPGRLTKDEAAWQDISTSGYEIQETCLDGQQRGGMQIIGEHNNLAVEVFAADSEHGEELMVTLGHDIPSYTYEPTEPVRPDYIDDTNEDEDDEDSVCITNSESVGWCLDASKCCSGYRFVLQKLQNVYQLLGIDAISAASIGTCSDL